MGCETLRVQSIPPGRSGPTPPKRRDAVQFRGGVPGLHPAMSRYATSHHARGSLLVRSRVFHTRPRVRFPPRARSLEGEVCVVQTPVPKTGWRASVRVRLLHLPQLEDDLAVARAPFAKRMDPDRLRFDSADFRASISFSHAPSQRAHTPAGSPGTSPSSWPCKRPSRPPHSSVHPFDIVASAHRSHVSHAPSQRAYTPRRFTRHPAS